jgi:uncharacterized membrane protein
MTKKRNGGQEQEKNKQIILDIVNNLKPNTTQQLIAILKEKTSLTNESITDLLIQLENEEKIYFTKKQDPALTLFQGFAFSRKAFWYWTVIALSAATALTVFIIPESAYPLAYLRAGLSLIFILILPGYSFIKLLFPSKLPVKTSTEDMDNIERAGLSFGMSIVLVPIVSLILNYSPWGVQLTPITLSLLALTTIFATMTLFREYQAAKKEIKLARSK